MGTTNCIECDGVGRFSCGGRTGGCCDGICGCESGPACTACKGTGVAHCDVCGRARSAAVVDGLRVCQACLAACGVAAEMARDAATYQAALEEGQYPLEALANLLTAVQS